MEQWMAAISLLGSLAGTLGGIWISSKLVEYRLTQLEKRLEEMKELVSRMYRLETRAAVQEERLKAMGKTFGEVGLSQ